MDVNVLAFRVVQKATEDTLPTSAKAASSRKGGIKGGLARARILTKERREEIARVASEARWRKRI